MPGSRPEGVFEPDAQAVFNDHLVEVRLYVQGDVVQLHLVGDLLELVANNHERLGDPGVDVRFEFECPVRFQGQVHPPVASRTGRSPANTCSGRRRRARCSPRKRSGIRSGPRPSCRCP